MTPNIKSILSGLCAGLILIGSGSLTTSCADSDFLNHEPYANGDTNKDFYKDPNNLRLAVDALNRFTSEEGTTGRGYMWMENASDNCITGRNQAEAAQIKNFTMDASNGRDWNENWDRLYQVISSANELIKAVNNLHVEGELRDYVLGNAYFYRGMAYLWLAPWHGDDGPNGGIPIITDKTSVSEMDSERPKSVLENYDLIISDMDQAAAHLPLFSQQSDDQYGRPWKAAAWGLAARAALYASQFDAKYYDKVIEYCDKIINLSGSDKRSLYPDFSTLFTAKNNFSSEYIFSFLGSATAPAGPKWHGMSFQNGGFGRFNTWGYFCPTAELYNAYEEGDVRRQASFAGPGDRVVFMDLDFKLGEPTISKDKQGKEIRTIDAKLLPSTPANILLTKWISPYRTADNAGKEFFQNGNFMCTTLGMVVLRYADILLMKAEALIWTKGEGNAEAVSILNQIRTRAGLSANSQGTKAELKQERRCELAFEFLSPRWLDLMRWGDFDLLEQPLHGFDLNYYGMTYDPATGKGERKLIEVWPARKFNPAVNKVFPIPQSAIDGSKHLKQNVGY